MSKNSENIFLNTQSKDKKKILGFDFPWHCYKYCFCLTYLFYRIKLPYMFYAFFLRSFILFSNCNFIFISQPLPPNPISFSYGPKPSPMREGILFSRNLSPKEVSSPPFLLYYRFVKLSNFLSVEKCQRTKTQLVVVSRILTV